MKQREAGLMVSLLGILCLIIFIFSNTALASEKVIVIGVEQLEYFPHYSHDGDQYKGFAGKLFKTFGKNKGYKIEFRILPLKRLLGEFLNGNVGFKYPDHPYWGGDAKKGKGVLYSEPVVGYIDGVMVLPQNKGKGINNLKKLGIVLGFTPWDYKKKIDAGQIKTDATRTFTSLMKKGISGRFDGAYVNVAVGRYQLSEVLKQKDALVFDADLPHTKDSYYFSTIKYPKILAEFNDFLSSQKETVNQIKAEFKIE